MKLEFVHRSVRLFPVLSVVKGFADCGAVETNDGEMPTDLRLSLRCSLYSTQLWEIILIYSPGARTAPAGLATATAVAATKTA